MLKSVRKNFVWLVLVILTLFWLAAGLNEISLPMIAEGDAYARANIGKKMMEQGYFLLLNGRTVWLPLHFTLINLPAWLGMDLFFGQRLMTLILSLVSVWLLYFYTLEHTRNQRVAFLASILFGFFPLRQILSTQTLTESVFICFFVGALYLLVKEKLKNIDLVLIVILTAIASLIRFEAWFFLPIIIGYILVRQDLSLKAKVATSLGLLTAPLAWITNNALASGQFLAFFAEKYNTANNQPNVNFYHWNLAQAGWEKQLSKTFPLTFLLVVAPAYSKLFTQFNPKKALFYLTPIYLFLVLVAQVYLGTMEWFPLRYLLIPTTFVIPIFSLSVYRLVRFIKKYLAEQQPDWAKASLLILAGLLSAALLETAQGTNQKTHLQLTTLSLMSLQDEEILKPKDWQKLESFTELKNQLATENSEKKLIEYYYNDQDRSWYDQALFYRLDNLGIDLNKSTFPLQHAPNTIIVWEKELIGQESHWQADFKIIFENQYFYLVELDSEAVFSDQQ